MRISCFVICTLAAWAAAYAHDKPLERRLYLDTQARAATWELQVTGYRAALLLTMYELDRDGVLSESERTRLAMALAAKAQGGVSLQCGEKTLKLIQPEFALVLRGQTLISIMRTKFVAPVCDITVKLLDHVSPLAVNNAKIVRPGESFTLANKQHSVTNLLP